MSESLRLVKKYPNRRLYDTKTSAYITLADVKGFVVAHEHFKVVDAKNGDDLTRSILLQIIIDEEGAGVPLFSSELLSQLIRFYGQAVEGMFSQYLEANIKAFSSFQQRLAEQPTALCGENGSPLPGELCSALLDFRSPAMPGVGSRATDQSRKTGHSPADRIEAPPPADSMAKAARKVGKAAK